MRIRPAWSLALGALLVYAASGGGRIVGSDEVTMLELSRALLHGHIAVPEGATMAGVGGATYSKNAAGQAVVALPLTALAEVATRAVAPARRELAGRALVSFFNAIVTAALLGVFYATARALGAGGAAAMSGALLLGFTTPLWVYAKSFMAEPLEALGLLLALGGAARARVGGRGASMQAALGLLLAVSPKLGVLPLAIGALFPLAGAPRRAWRWPLAALALALLFHGLYDLARFGTPLETGYGSQATPVAFSTPLLVGLYGLLLSSGKGVMWFAPALWLAPAGWRAMRAAAGRARAAATAVLLMAGAALLLYGSFQHWAGDGSFGPRYLIPVLPAAFLLVTFALDRASKWRRAWAALLGFAGLLVTLGGVAIYFGAQMREAGDYPYTLPLDHPHFMESSHFNPRFSPIFGHWSMLKRNLRLAMHDQSPHIAPGSAGERDEAPAPPVAGSRAGRGADVGVGAGRGPDARVGAGHTAASVTAGRLGLGEQDQRALLTGFDFWWAYAAYAGLPALPLALAALVMFLGGAALLAAAWRAAGSEAA